MKKRFSFLLLLALAPSLVTAQSPASPEPATPAAPRSTSLTLSADATRDEVKAMLKENGLPHDDAQVDRIMAKLAEAKGGAAPATPAVPETPAEPEAEPIDFPPDSTRDEVKALLKRNGQPDGDRQVDEVMAKLAEDRKLATGLHGYVKNKIPGMDLEFLPLFNQYHAKGRVNDKPVTLIIDSGAHSSSLSLEACERLGLQAERSGTATGIGGEEALFVTRIDSMQIGPHLKLPAQSIRASGMKNTRDEGNLSDGLIGCDILTAIGGIIDYRTHRLAYPAARNKADLAAAAEAAGVEEIVMQKYKSYAVLETRIKGQPVRFLLDTGAQQSVLDAAAAKRLGVSLMPSSVQIQGVGAKRQTTELASLDEITMGSDVKLHRMPMLVMPLGHVQGQDRDRFDGILGAEFLFATGAVFDTGNQKLYIEPGRFDVRDHTKTGGEMFGSDDELKQSIAAASRVLAGKLKTISVLDKTTTDAQGQVWKLVELEAIVSETLKGDAVPAGTKELVHVLVKDEPDLAKRLAGRIGRNPSKIFFLGEKSDGKTTTATAAELVVWTDGELARAQFKRVGIGQ